MQVYFIENENPFRDSSGGIMSYIINLSKYLKERRIRTVLLGSGKCKEDEIPFSEFISIIRKINASNFKYLLALIRKVAVLDIGKYTIIHAQRPDMLFSSILFNKKSILICTLHGTHDIAVFEKKGILYGYIYSILQKLSFRKANMLVAVDKATRDYYIRKYPWVRDKITVIPTGVDVKNFLPICKNGLREKYNFSQQDKIIIFVGRIEKEKNLLMLVEAFCKIKEEIENAKLVIVGRGRKEHSLKSKIIELNLCDIIFMGEVENKKIPELLNCADVFTFCSLYEGSPTVIKEALACNLSVVSVDVGDVKEVIDGIDGCYIVERDINDFSKKIIKVLTENKKINSREKMFCYSHENVGKRTLELYNSLLRKRFHSTM